MKSKESLAQHLAREAVQAIVRQERFGWPPDSLWGTYQPRRPDKPLKAECTNSNDPDE